MNLSIEDLPHPVIEYIFSYLSPYRDLKQCLLVNKTWYDLVQGAVRTIRRNFHHAVTARNVCWEHCFAENSPTISRRYSHSSSVCRDSMFVFGGCTTASTTFNDLWRLDLGTRTWIRPLATGTYPPPKACASMVCYSDSLILFGGWTHTSPYPLHQAWLIFNHLHIYNTNTNRWTQVGTTNTCPGMAGHTASMIGNKMVVFGGLHCQSGWGPFASSNEVWVLDVTLMTWKKQKTSNLTPHPRYGHSQITLDSNHIIIIGGCGGPNMLFSDIWLLKTSEDTNGVWEWKEIDIMQKDNSAPQLTFHPAVMVGSKVVVLSKAQWSRTLPSCLPQLLRVPSRTWIPPVGEIFARPDPRFAPKPAENEVCVNGRKGVLKRYFNRSLARKGDSNTSSSDDDELQNNKLPPKKGISTFSTSNDLSSPSTSSQEHFSTVSSGLEGHVDVKASNKTVETSLGATSVDSVFVPVIENLVSNSDSFSTVDLIFPPTTTTRRASDSMSSSSSSTSLSDAPASTSTSTSPMDHPPTTSASRPTLSIRPNARRNRQRQLEGLDRMEQRLRHLRANSVPRCMIPKASLTESSSNPSQPKNPMCLYVLDIGSAVQNNQVTWLAPQFPSNSGLEEIILYSLVLGKGELIMFGGIQKDLNSYTHEGEKVPQIVSNSLHFISAFKYII